MRLPASGQLQVLAPWRKAWTPQPFPAWTNYAVAFKSCGAWKCLPLQVNYWSLADLTGIGIAAL